MSDFDYEEYLEDRYLAKWERRDRELQKRKHGMRMDGKGTRLLGTLSIKDKPRKKGREQSWR
jgi:hypothetical protein